MDARDDAIQDDQALRLATAVSRLRAAIRDARWQVTDLAITQVAILRHLEKAGPSTAAELASAEHISPQAVAQQLRGLKERGYVSTEPDLVDGRKTRILLTTSGVELLYALLETREAWLARAIAATVPQEELADLGRAIDVLERLANAVMAGDVGREPS